METQSELKKLMKELIHSEGSKLNLEKLKCLKRTCQTNPAAIPFIFDLTLESMTRSKHCQIRLSSFRLADYLFRRSALFRKNAVRKLKQIVESTLENPSLPPPESAAKELKRFSLIAIKEWTEMFGTSFPKLKIAIRYLKTVQNRDFADVEARDRLEVEREQRRTLKMENIWKERVRKVKSEIEEKKQEIQNLEVQIESCLELLVPHFNDGENDEDADDKRNDSDLDRSNGILNKLNNVVTIDLKSVTECDRKIRITEDNSVIVENLRDQSVLLRNHVLPMVKKWAVILTKAGDSTDRSVTDLLKVSIDVKRKLEILETKITDIIGVSTKTRVDDSSTMSSSDDEFEDVPEKEGYEEEVKIDNNRLPAASTSTFEPVKWSCRAPLPSGKLCPRRDKIKCPFHGRIVARNEMGERADGIIEDQKRDWNDDPSLLRDIEAAIGINLDPKKTKKKHLPKTTARDRLEKKLFRPSTKGKIKVNLTIFGSE